MFDFKIRTTGKIIRFKSDDARYVYNASKEAEFKHLVYSGTKAADLIFDIRYGMIPDFSGKKPLFNADGGWWLSRYEDKLLFEYPDREQEGRMAKVAQVNGNMTEGIIYVNRDKTPDEKERLKRQLRRVKEKERRALGIDQRESKQTVSALTTNRPEQKRPETPEPGQKLMTEISMNFVQAFLVYYFIRKEIGFIAHCSSVQNGNRLYLFMGQSQAGKSTIAGFWHKTAGTAVFNDDRACITVKDRTPYFYNAPWGGTFKDSCDLGAGDGTKIDRIFFIYHKSSNTLKRLSAVESAAKIFQNSFSVFWEPGALNFVLNMCSKIAASVPCYDLGFVNDKSVVAFLKKELSR